MKTDTIESKRWHKNLLQKLGKGQPIVCPNGLAVMK